MQDIAAALIWSVCGHREYEYVLKSKRLSIYKQMELNIGLNGNNANKTNSRYFSLVYSSLSCGHNSPLLFIDLACASPPRIKRDKNSMPLFSVFTSATIAGAIDSFTALLSCTAFNTSMKPDLLTVHTNDFWWTIVHLTAAVSSFAGRSTSVCYSCSSVWCMKCMH